MGVFCLEKHVSTGAMLGIVLVALAAVIGSGFAIFAITKGSANEGTMSYVEQTDNGKMQWLNEFNDATVYGTTVMNIFDHVDEGVAIFINTRLMNNEIPISAGHNILQYNSNVYVNYGCQFNYTDDGYKYQEGILGYEVDSALLVPRDSNSLKTDYHFIVDESGHFIKDKVVGGCYSRGNAEFIELNAHFQTNLIYGPAGVPVGIIVKQVNRPTAATNTEANSGYNGIGTYYPNGTSSGNIGSNIGGASGGGGGLLPDTWDSVEGNIPPENVVVQVAGGSGGGQFAVGDTVTLVADEGVGTFVGWYQGSTLVSTSKTFNFSPTSNGHYTLTAKWRS